jgi:hypothetical protein
VALLCVVLVEASSVADECGECGVLGAPSFRLGDGGDGGGHKVGCSLLDI